MGGHKEEGVVLIARAQQQDHDDTRNEAKDEAKMNQQQEQEMLPINLHKLQPPLHGIGSIRGDILLLCVRPYGDDEPMMMRLMMVRNCDKMKGK